MLWYRRRTVPPRVPPERIEVWVQPLTDADGHAKLYDLGRGGTTEAEYMQWDMIPLDIFVEGSSNLDEEDQLSNGPSLHTDYIDVDNDTT